MNRRGCSRASRRGSTALLALALASAQVAGMGSVAWAQDGTGKGKQTVDIFLEDEKLDVEADIPSVELVLTFKGLRYETIELKRTFLPELYETVEGKPF